MFPPDGRVVHPSHRQSQRAICTFAIGTHRELAAISVEASRRYAARWGWDVVASAEPELAHDRPPSWAKVRLTLGLLARYEWVWCIDADALIVDLDRDIMAEIDPQAGPLWLASHPQDRDPVATVPNAGVILARRSPAIVGFLSRVWAQDQFVDHNWWENAAILHLLGRSLEPPFQQVRETRDQALVSDLGIDWNVVPGYVEAARPALHHHARADHDSFERRRAAMQADLDRLAR